MLATTTFNADDAALAVSMMTDAATEDLPYTSRAELDAQYTRIEGENRSLVLNVAKLHGLNQLGNMQNGDEGAAKSVIQQAQAYKADPTAYVDDLHGVASNDTAPAAPASVTEAAPAAPAPVATPAMSFEQAAAPSPIQQPVAKLRFVPRPAGGIFPGITSTYNSDLVPTAVWETPRPVIADPDPDFQFNGFNVATMAMAIEGRKNVIATGDPGCGKTEFFKQFGARIGLPVFKVPFDGNLTRAEIIGSFRQVATPTGSATPFVLGLIPRLIQQPCIIVLDEIDQADPDIMYMLHPVFEGEGLTIQEEGGTLIPRHEHCYIVATANTKGRGSDSGLTHARFEMSEATRDRFPYWLNFTFMEAAQEAKTIHAKTGMELDLCTKLVTVAGNIRQAYKNGSISQTCSLRQMLDVVPAFNRFRGRGDNEGLALGTDTVMIGRANEDDANGIREWVKLTLAVDLTTLER